MYTYCSEYIKVLDGAGTEVLALHGCDPFYNETFREIPVGNLTRITIQIFLAHKSSLVEIDYGTLKQALDSGKKQTQIKRNLYERAYFVI